VCSCAIIHEWFNKLFQMPLVASLDNCHNKARFGLYLICETASQIVFTHFTIRNIRRCNMTLRVLAAVRPCMNVLRGVRAAYKLKRN
jgi:hypothetical protein